jgi:ferredoxin-NADP reductase
MTQDTYLFRFTWQDPAMSLGLPCGGNHLFFHMEVDGENMKRKYTPISDVRRPAYADFVIKVYRPNE